MNALFGWTRLAAMLVFVAGTVWAQPSEPDAAAQPERASAEAAVLYLFNDSGRTLIPGKQAVSDNDQRLASLPRQTYARIPLTPGRHVLRPDPALWKQEVVLDAVPGGKYFVVVAYRPERSWAVPFAGAPLLLKEISEGEAQSLLKEMTAEE